ncbi:amidohydrolase 2 [Cadophora sp. DSE1049]|nr:amidohydrolase 2 [Cadophora sp. DSE1049]
MTTSSFVGFLTLATCSVLVSARVWNDTGVGSIIFEEAVNVHNQRLTWMDESGVDYMVLSCTSPCIQGISNATLASSLAKRVNNDIADLISNNTMRFGAFAALAMHNATEAAAELNRTVVELGFLGTLINDFQQSGADKGHLSLKDIDFRYKETLLYYDQPEYDVFWAMAQELNVPIYLHPRGPTPAINKLDFAHSPWLLGAPHQFAVELSNHIVGLCANGIFDRFPNVKVVVGHLGERIPSDFWRIDEMLARKVPAGMPMKRTFSSYWKTNIYETTSGNFWTELMDWHIKLLGADRVLYSVDYPFNMMQQGAAWVNSLPYSQVEKWRLVRGNAIELLKLND